MAGRSIITPGRLELNMQILKLAVLGITLAAIGSTKTGGGQMLPASSPPWSNQMPGMSQGERMQRIEQQKLLISERQKRLIEDTDKLLMLSTALKEQVNESDKNVLSLDMIKKADQIEKLAHSVKERIKG
jgi:hypothetical protein